MRVQGLLNKRSCLLTDDGRERAEPGGWGTGGPAGGLPGLVAGANGSELEGAWVPVHAERAFRGKVRASKMPRGDHLTSLRLSFPTINSPGRGGGV